MKYFKVIAPLIFIIVFIIILAFGYKNISYINNSPNTSPFSPITNENIFVQKINMDGIEDFNNIDILLATYARENTNTNKFSLLDEQGNVLYESEFNSADVDDNAYYTFDDIDIDTSEHEYIYMVIESEDGTNDNGITVWLTPKSDESLNTLYSMDSEGNLTEIEGMEAKFMVYEETNLIGYVDFVYKKPFYLLLITLCSLFGVMFYILIPEKVGSQNETDNTNTLL